MAATSGGPLVPGVASMSLFFSTGARASNALSHVSAWLGSLNFNSGLHIDFGDDLEKYDSNNLSFNG